MIFRGKVSPMLCLGAILLLLMFCTCTPQGSDNAVELQPVYKGVETFGDRIYSEFVKNNRKNIIFSPFSIHTCLGMVRMGAEGETALEMDQVMALTQKDPEHLANSYHNMLEQYQKSSVLKMANKLYINQGSKVEEKFNELLTQQFFSSVDAVNFANNNEAARSINTWVENKTNNLIKDLIDPTLLNEGTRLVLVNAIHFKGNWLNPFPKYRTREMEFYLDETNTFKTQMMHIEEEFNYGEFSELDAAALEMPYKDSDLSMLIILPNSRTGLAELEHKLQTASLDDLTNRMSSTNTIVDLPKFKAEFKQELSETLKNMGMKRMFSENAELGKMLKNEKTLQVTAAIHKAFIEVNEVGTEAAAATGILSPFYSGVLYIVPPKRFTVDRPFYYIIKNKLNVPLFMGNIQSKF